MNQQMKNLSNKQNTSSSYLPSEPLNFLNLGHVCSRLLLRRPSIKLLASIRVIGQEIKGGDVLGGPKHHTAGRETVATGTAGHLEEV